MRRHSKGPRISLLQLQGPGLFERSSTAQFVYDGCVMRSIAPCEECQAIVMEYERACLDFWLNASEETRDACRAIRQLVTGGTEADVALAQQLLPSFKAFRSPVNADAMMSYSGIGPLVYRKVQHEAKTGHYVRLRPVYLCPSPPSDLS